MGGSTGGNSATVVENDFYYIPTGTKLGRKKTWCHAISMPCVVPSVLLFVAIVQPEVQVRPAESEFRVESECS